MMETFLWEGAEGRGIKKFNPKAWGRFPGLGANERIEERRPGGWIEAPEGIDKKAQFQIYGR